MAVSRILYPLPKKGKGRLSFIYAAYPLRGFPSGEDRATATLTRNIFGISAHGVCLRHALPHDGVRSYRTFSPLPVLPTGSHRRCLFCGTFRHYGITPAVPTLADGVVLCAVRTFLTT